MILETVVDSAALHDTGDAPCFKLVKKRGA